jgi:glycosyltransferase involved in cell wall biosynthesis
VYHVHQVNLQAAAGGGEIYTRWFSRALADAGAQVSLYVDPRNEVWNGLDSDRIKVVATINTDDVVRRLPSSNALVITQSRIPASFAEHLAKNHVLTGFAHMPMHDGRSASEFKRYSAVFTVSKYCIGLLRNSGISQVYPEPLYGTFSIDRQPEHDGGEPIRARSAFHWDERKGRDRILSRLEPLASTFRKDPIFLRKPGMTLGIVSLLSPIKQFPLLFSLLAPHMAEVGEVNLEIFGNGGYAQVRDLKRALAPIANRVRFWGYQRAVRFVYPQLDYLMTGLPEKEALGLNVLESQALGTPVLAPAAPPFTETILHGQSGFLYPDPRTDEGRGFRELLACLKSGRARPDPRMASTHMSQFSYAAMVERAKAMLEYLHQTFPQLRRE